MNLTRRQLSDYDKVKVANELGSLPVGSNQHTAGAGRSQAEMARMLNTSVDTIQRGMKIMHKGTHELRKAVEEKRISVSAGADLVELPKEKQIELATDPAITTQKISRAINLNVKQKHRAEKAAMINEQVKVSLDELGKQLHSVVYADPPWQYLGEDGTPYGTMKSLVWNASTMLKCPAS